MKRALGVAVLGGGLLALNAGSASAQEVSADISARLGRPTSAEVRVCADGRVLSRLLGGCSSSGGTSVTVRAGRDGDGSGEVRARARVPGVASADVSLGTRRSRAGTTASGQASATPARAATVDGAAAADTSPRADAAATTDLSEPLLDLRLLDSRPLASFAGVGLLGSSPFTLAGDPATGSLLAVGDLLPESLTGEAPAGIGVLGTGPIASGNQVAVDVGDVSPSVPVTVCGNSVGVLGDTSASCGATQAPTTGAGSTGSTGAPTGSTGSAGTSAGTGGPAGDPLLADLASGNQVDAGIGDVSPSVPVTVCGNGVGVLGDATAGCGADQQASGGGTAGGSAGGSTGASAGTGTIGSGTLLDDVASGNQVDAGVGAVSASAPVTICGNSVGALGDASASCGTGRQAGGSGPTQPSGGGGSTPTDGSGNQAGAGVGDVSASVPVTACGNGIGLLGDASASCGADTSSGGIVAPPPATTDPDGTTDTGTSGIPGTDTGTSGIPGTVGLTPGTSGGPGDPITTFAPLRPLTPGSGAGALPFTGAGSDLLAVLAGGLLAVGALVVRATRPAAVREGGGDR